MVVFEAVAVVAGLALITLGILDLFLTVLHPDRDGPASVAMNRAIWSFTVWLAVRVPRAARELFAVAGGFMIMATIALWMLLQVLGFAILAWPFLATGFVTDHPGAPTLLDAVYWSGITFTTLGYGDVIPATPFWKIVALVEALLGFALVGAAITFLLSVFTGIEYRDRMALRIYSETRRTWNGTLFVARVLAEEGPEGVLRHVDAWAGEMRSLHERLYRFQPLAFYLRTRSEKHEPERMLEAVADVALTARILSGKPGLHALHPAAEEMEIAYTEFTLSAIRHHGSKEALRACLRPQPNATDRARIARIWQVVQGEVPVEGAPWENADDERDILAFAALVRTFLDELDRITKWRTIRAVS